MIYHRFTAQFPKKDEDQNQEESLDLLLNESDYSRRFSPVRNTNGPYTFLANQNDNEATLYCAIEYDCKESAREVMESFLKSNNREFVSLTGEEISLSEFLTALDSTDLNDFADNNGQDPEKATFNLTRLFMKDFVRDHLAPEDITLDQALSKANSFYFAGLKDEIQRIFEEPDRPFLGHPAHYMFFSDDSEAAAQAVDLLVSCLYSKGRLKSRRISTITPPGRRIRELRPWEVDFIPTVYSSQGGSVVNLKSCVRRIDSDRIAASDNVCSESVSKAIIENRHKTLTIFTYPKSEYSRYEKFQKAFPNVNFIAFSDCALDFEKAGEKLKAMAQTQGFDDCSSLLSKLMSDKTYNHYEITDLFDSWRDSFIRSDVFPSYSTIERHDVSAAPEKSLSAYQKLQNLIGLGSAKQTIQQAIDFNRYQSIFSDRGAVALKPTRHMVFTGNPGTAKTTVARLFAQIMADYNILPEGKLIEVGRQDLVGKYVGWTANLVTNAFDSAKGSVLFIDEAYSLCDDREGMFGDEAINTIVQLMENRREDTIVIFAGYPDKMEAFLNRNPGLRSRIGYHIDFEDYSEDELVQILNLFAAENHFKLDDSVEALVRKTISEAIGSKDFGNGRFVRNMFEKARMKQASRLVNSDPHSITDEQFCTLTAEDFDTTSRNRTPNRTIGFAC